MDFGRICGIVFAVQKDNEITSHDMALLYILKETKNLEQYFGKYEKDELKMRMKETKKNPQNKQLEDLMNYVSDISAIAMACIVMGQ